MIALRESLLRFIAASSGTNPTRCLDSLKSGGPAEHRQWLEMPHEACQPCGLDRFAVLNIALFPAAGTRLQERLRPWHWPRVRAPLWSPPHQWLWSRPRAKRRVWPPVRNPAGSGPLVSGPLRLPRRSAGGGLCRSPRIGALSLISCRRGSFRLYRSVFTICQYGNMGII